MLYREITQSIVNEMEMTDSIKNDWDNIWIFMIKPDWLARFHGVNEAIEDLNTLFFLTDLIFQSYRCKKLTKKDIFWIYPHLLLLSPFWEERKEELYNHLASSESLIWIVSGTSVNRKLTIMKHSLRKNLLWEVAGKDKAIKNIIHVPDDHELDRDINLLYIQK